jgi:hypothetical protein
MSPICVRTTSKRRSVVSIPQADNTAATRGTITREIKLARNLGRVQPRGAAKGEQREMPWIDATTDRHEPHPLGHRRVDDAVDAARRG